jgi:hypothetical protein
MPFMDMKCRLADFANQLRASLAIIEINKLMRSLAGRAVDDLGYGQLA